jgi:hypothetical protein
MYANMSNAMQRCDTESERLHSCCTTALKSLRETVKDAGSVLLLLFALCSNKYHKGHTRART